MLRGLRHGVTIAPLTVDLVPVGERCSMNDARGDNQLPPLPLEVTEFCATQGLGGAVSMQPLKGGAISSTHRLVTATKVPLILKQSRQAPPALYARERDGLQTLRAATHLRVPVVYAVGPTFLLLEDLGTAPPQAQYWEAFGHALALQHQQTNPYFGFAHDNYLGLLPQHNPWMADGHAFFAQHRVLRYLDTPLCQHSLTVQDQQALERFAARLRDLVPAQPASLLHGDLWKENMAVGPQGEPAMIDPAVYYGWPEAELSMVRQYPGVPDTFFAAYREIHPLIDGWMERLELLFIREWLSIIAHFGNRHGTVEKVRALLVKYG